MTRYKVQGKKYKVYGEESIRHHEGALPHDLRKDKGIKLDFIKIDSLEKAKNAPCVFNNWANFYKGKFISNTILNANAFEKLLK